MTEKSEAQLDAEAAGRHEHLEATIALHREMHRDDAYLEKLVSTQPPTTRDANTGIVSQHEATRVGMNMSSRLYRYVEAPGGAEYPWWAAFKKLRYHCRSAHRKIHTGPDVPYWRGSLCQEAVRLVVIGPERRLPAFDGPLTIHQASGLLRYDNLAPVLRYAFAYIESSMDDFRAKAEKRAREDEGHGPGPIPTPTPGHHAVGGLHAVDCPNPACRKAA